MFRAAAVCAYFFLINLFLCHIVKKSFTNLCLIYYHEWGQNSLQNCRHNRKECPLQFLFLNAKKMWILTRTIIYCFLPHSWFSFPFYINYYAEGTGKREKQDRFSRWIIFLNIFFFFSPVEMKKNTRAWLNKYLCCSTSGKGTERAEQLSL